MKTALRAIVWKGKGFTLECDTYNHYGIDDDGVVHGVEPCNHHGVQKLALLWQIASQDDTVRKDAEASFEDRKALVAMKYL